MTAYIDEHKGSYGVEPISSTTATGGALDLSVPDTERLAEADVVGSVGSAATAMTTQPDPPAELRAGAAGSNGA
jgi:hypothetical protein